MEKYLLDNYHLTKYELVKTLFVSEYGLRHLKQAKLQSPQKSGHRLIAVIELCPLIGLIASLIDTLINKLIKSHCQIPLPPLPLSLPPSSLIIKKQWVFKGNQATCNGPVSINKVKSICTTLSTNCPLGIRFNQKKVTDQIENGTCTAMALEFLDSYFKVRKSSIVNNTLHSTMLVNSIKQLGHKFSTSSIDMRNRQAAFNTIEVETSGSFVDYSKNKIQSLAAYHSLVIGYASAEINIDQLNSINDFSKEIEALPEGGFIVRTLLPANNEKLEMHGHTLIFIKEKTFSFFYDPNAGAKCLLSKNSPKFIFKKLKECFNSFNTSKARFYHCQQP